MRDYLLANLGGDRQLSRRELEKLCLYVGAGGQASFDDVVACIGDSSTMTLDDLLFAVAAGSVDATAGSLGRIRDEGVAPVAVLRAMQRHLQRLHLADGLRRGGLSAEDSMRQLRPPVFWKQQQAFKQQQAQWSTQDLEAALAQLTEAEVVSKTTGLPAQAVCERALLRIARSAARGRAGR